MPRGLGRADARGSRLAAELGVGLDTVEAALRVLEQGGNHAVTSGRGQRKREAVNYRPFWSIIRGCTKMGAINPGRHPPDDRQMPFFATSAYDPTITPEIDDAALAIPLVAST